jgi:hypothetical protein
VNPHHLYPGTIVENTRDMITRGRHHVPPRKTHCSQGHAIAGENLRVIRCASGEVRHKCRVCDNEKSKAKQAELRARRKATA